MPSESVSAEQLAAMWAKAQPQIAGYISSLVRNFHDADDIVQNVASVVVRKREQYDPQNSFVGWALNIAKFEVLAFRRTAARDRHQFSEDVVDLVSETYRRVTPEHTSRREALATCIERLKDRARQAIHLRYTEGLNFGEVGRQMNLSTNAATVAVSRARKSLHDCIERQLGRSESNS